MKKFYKVVYHYFGENGNYIGKGGKQIAYFPKKIKRKSWWLSLDNQIIIDQVSIVKM